MPFTGQSPSAALLARPLEQPLPLEREVKHAPFYISPARCVHFLPFGAPEHEAPTRNHYLFCSAAISSEATARPALFAPIVLAEGP